MSTRKNGVSRRSFLGALGMGGLAAALPSFFSRIPSARAAAPKRFVVFFTPNEPIDRERWLPAGDGSSFALPAALPAMLAPLEPHRDKLVMIGDMKAQPRFDVDDKGKGGHDGMGCMLTGTANVSTGPEAQDFWAGGVSVDQYIAAQLGLGAPLTLAALPGAANGNTRISYTGKSQPVHPYDDPAVAFDQVFGGFTGSAAEQDAYRAQRRSVLDAAAGHAGALKGRLPGEDRVKLEMHLDSIASLRDKLDGAGALSCNTSALDKRVNGGGYNHKSNADYPVTGRLQMDILVQALACGARSVGSVQLGNSGAGHITPSWPDEGVVSPWHEHDLAHGYNQGGQYRPLREELETFYFRQFAYLLSALDAVPEGGGTLLDSTLVLWTKNLGTAHKWDPMLYMLAGGGAMGLTTGRFHSFPGRPHNHLLALVCQLMGVEGVEGFGDPAYKGVLSLS